MPAEKLLDDPGLTAFALGELAGEEAAAVAKLVAANPEAAQFVADVRGAARVLEGSLAKEKLPRLTPTQRETLVAGRAAGGVSLLSFLRPAAALALVALVAGVWGHHYGVPVQLVEVSSEPDVFDQAAGIMGKDANLFERVSKTTFAHYSK
ncbi:MAG: hypothetical protein HY075_13755 [Deltaproteobacteria bacterium]|nr:hypothetical protein [Deltaproteobacteria bacterium]